MYIEIDVPINELEASNRKHRKMAMKALRKHAKKWRWDSMALNRATDLPLGACYGWMDGTVTTPTEKSCAKIIAALHLIARGDVIQEDGWVGRNQTELPLDDIVDDFMDDGAAADSPVTEPTHPVEKDPKFTALLRTNAEYAYLLEIYRGLYKLDEAEVLLNGYRQGRFAS